MTLINNERTKLLANALDRASTACFTVGIATPLAGYLYGVLNFGQVISGAWLMFTIVGWLGVTFALHTAARRILKGLRQ